MLLFKLEEIELNSLTNFSLSLISNLDFIKKNYYTKGENYERIF